MYTPVVSSNLRGVDYDEINSTLDVTFTNGYVYRYYNVPISKYYGLLNAYSKGSYLHNYIIDGGYRYKRLR